MGEWTTACPDWERRIVERESLIACPPLFEDKAQEALEVFKSLQMTDLPMKRDGTWPTLGEACEPFVFDLVEALFGAQDPDTGESRIKEAMLLISKKNGKSTIAAAIMLTALIQNWRHGAELLVLAPTKEIAKNSFDPAAAMVRADPDLRTLLHVQDHLKTIKHRETQAELKIVSADAGVVGGKKAGFVLVDELWLFGKKEGAESMLEEATGGQAARPEGWTLYLSTHSDEPPAGVFKAKLNYFRDVRDGVIHDPSSLPMLYEWPEWMLEAEAYLDPANFYVTNPNIGKSPTIAFIQRKIDQLQTGDTSDGDSSLQIVLAKYLNVEIGLRLRRDRWRGADYWDKSINPDLRDLDVFLDACEVVVAGFDGGGDDDLSGLFLLGRCKRTREWLGWSRAWVHYMALELRKEIAPALRDFAKAGDLVIWGAPDTDTAELGDYDIEEIADILAMVRERGLMPEKGAVGVDAAGLGTLVDALMQRDFTNDQIWSVGQGYRLTGVIHTVQRKLWSGQLTHGGSEMMAWCVSNAKAEQKGNAVLITKQTAGKAKIDPVIALFNAAKLMERSPEADSGKGPESWLESLRGAA